MCNNSETINISNGIKWISFDSLNKLYGICIAVIVGVISRHGPTITGVDIGGHGREFSIPSPNFTLPLKPSKMYIEVLL